MTPFVPLIRQMNLKVCKVEVKKNQKRFKSVEFWFFCVTDGFSSRRQHDSGDRPTSKNWIFPDRLRRLPRFHWRLCNRLRTDKWVLHIVKYTAAPARQLYFVFQRRCLRCQISVSLRRVCSLCVWAGRPPQGRLMVSRSWSQNVCWNDAVIMMQFNSFLSSVKNQCDVCKIWLWSMKYYWPAADRPGFIYEQLLPGDTSSHVVDSLEEDKEYTVSIFAIYPQGPSQPISLVGKTCKYIAHLLQICWLIRGTFHTNLLYITFW